MVHYYIVSYEKVGIFRISRQKCLIESNICIETMEQKRDLEEFLRKKEHCLRCNIDYIGFITELEFRDPQRLFSYPKVTEFRDK